ncbi:uncharacterized protein [Montipora foliosa]|uniref:uncharacterized protein n=1 Tax=Montipora foliosa TaxID=591990 RepID=UPI0035F180D0
MRSTCILTDKPHIVTDVTVINRFNTGSDHRLVRGTLAINTKLERARLTRRQKRPNGLVLSAKATEFQLLLTNRFEALEMERAEDLDAYSNNITTTIKETAVEIAGRDKPLRQEKLSRIIRQLREKRRQMKRSGTVLQHTEHTSHQTTHEGGNK